MLIGESELNIEWRVSDQEFQIRVELHITTKDLVMTGMQSRTMEEVRIAQDQKVKGAGFIIILVIIQSGGAKYSKTNQLQKGSN